MKHLRVKRLVLIGSIAALACTARAAAFVQVVYDPWNKVVLLNQLTQLKQQLQDIQQQLQIAEANIRNFNAAGWGSTIQDVSQVDAQLSGVGRTVSNNDPGNLQAATASAQLQQIGGEESDLRYAQSLSEGASGQMEATEAGNRLQSLAIGQIQKEHELLLSNVVQTESDNERAAANESEPSALGDRL